MKMEFDVGSESHLSLISFGSCLGSPMGINLATGGLTLKNSIEMPAGLTKRPYCTTLE